MLTVCPCCHHTFQAEVHPRCSSTIDDDQRVQLSVSATIRLPTVICSTPNGINCTVKVNSSLQRLSKDDLIRNTMSGGRVICMDSEHNKDNCPIDNMVNRNFSDEKFSPRYQNIKYPNIADGNSSSTSSVISTDNTTTITAVTTITTVNNGASANFQKHHSASSRRAEQDDSVTPTSSLSFVIPQSSGSSDFTCYTAELDRLLKKTVAVRNLSVCSTDFDVQRLASTLNFLQLSGWYHRGLSWKDSMRLLMQSAVGTFLVRDSSDAHFMYSLSIQTKCGPTSIRVCYCNGEFRLDAEPRVAKFMPQFSCVLKLIQYYVDSTKSQPLRCFQNENASASNNNGGPPPLWHRSSCNSSSSSCPIFTQISVVKPFYINVPSLKHFCRLNINRHFSRTDEIVTNVLPTSLIGYLQQYPYKY